LYYEWKNESTYSNKHNTHTYVVYGIA
jgi:hypothetical protein